MFKKKISIPSFFVCIFSLPVPHNPFECFLQRIKRTTYHCSPSKKGQLLSWCVNSCDFMDMPLQCYGFSLKTCNIRYSKQQQQKQVAQNCSISFIKEASFEVFSFKPQQPVCNCKFLKQNDSDGSSVSFVPHAIEAVLQG